MNYDNINDFHSFLHSTAHNFNWFSFLCVEVMNVKGSCQVVDTVLNVGVSACVFFFRKSVANFFAIPLFCYSNFDEVYLILSIDLTWNNRYQKQITCSNYHRFLYVVKIGNFLVYQHITHFIILISSSTSTAQVKRDVENVSEMRLKRKTMKHKYTPKWQKEHEQKVMWRVLFHKAKADYVGFIKVANRQTKQKRTATKILTKIPTTTTMTATPPIPKV